MELLAERLAQPSETFSTKVSEKVIFWLAGTLVATAMKLICEILSFIVESNHCFPICCKICGCNCCPLLITWLLKIVAKGDAAHGSGCGS